MKTKLFVAFGILSIIATAHLVQAQDSETSNQEPTEVNLVEEILPIVNDSISNDGNASENTTIVAEPETNETIVVDIDTPNPETVPPADEENVLVGDPDNGEIIVGNIDGEEEESPITTDEENLNNSEDPLSEDEVIGQEDILPTEEIPLEEEIIPVELIEEQIDSEGYITAKDIQEHLDFVNSLPKISSENTVKDISNQEFSECNLPTPILEVTESIESITDLDISKLENKNSFDLGLTPLGIDIIIETSSFVKDLFKEEQVTLVVDAESETQKGIFSVPLVATDRESKEKSICQITVLSE